MAINVAAIMYPKPGKHDEVRNKMSHGLNFISPIAQLF
jgi:hypothetical protein